MNTDNEEGMRGRCWLLSSSANITLLPDLCNDLDKGALTDYKITDR